MIWLVIVFVITLLIGVPVAFCLGIAGVVFMLITHEGSLMTIPTSVFGAIDSFILMAIPLFVMTGFLADRAGILPGLVKLADALVGHLRGGLAHVNIVASMFFAGVSGLALADTAAIGSMLIPPMIKQGYDRTFTAVVTASSSLVGPIIPPSVAMVLYAFIAGGDVSVAGLFLAGAIPGIVLGLGMMVLTYFIALRRNYPISGERFTFVNALRAAKGGILGLMIPIIILGGILTGVFTPTEAGAVGVFYAVFVGFFITQRLTLKDMLSCFLEASKTSAVVFMMLANAKIVVWILLNHHVHQKLGIMLQSITTNPQLFLLLSMLGILLMGFVLEGIAIMVMMVPIFVPIVSQYGIDQHHFGLLYVMVAQTAQLTPPVAIGLSIACGLSKTTIEKAFLDVWPFLLLIYGIIAIVVLFPAPFLWLPRLFGYG